MEEFDENVIQETPEYSPKSEFSKPALVSQAVLLCTQFRASEMRDGYYNTKISKEGLPFKIWIPDSREKFFGAVHALLNLLSPEIARDEEAKKNLKEFEKQKEELFNKYIYEELEEYFDNGVLKFKKTGRKFMPKPDAKVILPTLQKETKRVIGEEHPGGWNNKLNDYKDDLVPLYDKLFQKLSDLIDRCNYFKVGQQF